MRFKFLIPLLLIACSVITPAHAFPKIEEAPLAHGKLWIAQDASVPTVAVRINFRGAGYAYADGDKQGLTSVLADMLTEGAGGMSSQEFAQKLDELAIKLDFYVLEEDFGISLLTLKENLPEAMRLMSLALTKPNLDQKSLDILKERTLAFLKRQEQDPEYIAGKEWRKAYFGAHPFSKDGNGNPDSIKAITVDDLKKLHSTLFAWDKAVVSVAGDVSAGEITELLDSNLKSLPIISVEQRTLPQPENLPASIGLSLVAMPIPQSIISFGLPGLARTHADYYSLLLANSIFGAGGFSSRLMQEAREKQGLVYGISTTLDTIDTIGIIEGEAATKNEDAEKTIALIKSEMRRFAETGATESELADAKAYLTGSFPMNFDTNSKIASIMLGMQKYNLGRDYLERYRDIIGAIPLEDVNATARDLYREDRLTVVRVGG